MEDLWLLEEQKRLPGQGKHIERHWHRELEYHGGGREMARAHRITDGTMGHLGHFGQEQETEGAFMWSNIKHCPLSFLTREDLDLRQTLLPLLSLTSITSPAMNSDPTP